MTLLLQAAVHDETKTLLERPSFKICDNSAATATACRQFAFRVYISELVLFCCLLNYLSFLKRLLSYCLRDCLIGDKFASFVSCRQTYKSKFTLKAKCLVRSGLGKF